MPIQPKIPNPQAVRKIMLAAVAACAVAAAPVIKKFEGEKKNAAGLHVAYKDLAGIPTKCWGETLGVKMGGVYTEEQCNFLLLPRIQTFAGEIANCAQRPMELDTFVAFTSFAYNIGGPAACNSAAMKNWNAGLPYAACEAMANWSCITVPMGKGENPKAKRPQSLCLRIRAGKPLPQAQQNKKFVKGLYDRRGLEMAQCKKGIKL